VTGAVSVVERLLGHAATHGGQSALTTLADGEAPSEAMTFDELVTRARAGAVHLAQQTRVGDRVLVVFPTGLDFVVGFLACLFSGRIAVPLPALDTARVERDLKKLLLVATDAEPSLVLAPRDVRDAVAAARELDEALDEAMARTPWVDLAQVEPSDGTRYPGRPQVDGDIAYLQYTSGSTSRPKGVVITHENVMANLAFIQRSMSSPHEENRHLTWLPHYHDMGLVEGVLHPLYGGFHGYLMPPHAFLQRPARWVKAVHRYRITNSGGPNFGYEYTAKKTPQAERAGLDLSCWRVAFNGAEPVRLDTIEKFCATFEGQGFRPQAFYPCYGLAEFTLKASGRGLLAPVKAIGVKVEALERGEAEVLPVGAPRSRSYVSNGPTGPGMRLEIVDPASHVPLPERRVGEIWLCASSVAAGYWRNDDETTETLKARLADGSGPFLRTGDLGFLHERELYVTGRAKDLIIVHGKNHYPHDLELTAERVDPLVLRAGCLAAFAVEGPEADCVVVVAEVQREWAQAKNQESVAALLKAMRAAVRAEHGVEVARLALVLPNGVPKTSSGKVQRSLTARLLQTGKLTCVVDDQGLVKS
jgi:acyl-CoA synthetase (AMP-forming)/AMP-acid ligase II